MYNQTEMRDRWGNLMSLDPPFQTVSPPTAAWLGHGNVYGNVYDPYHPERVMYRTTFPSNGQPPVPTPPPPYGPFVSDLPPPPSSRIELPPPSPLSVSTGGALGFPANSYPGPPGSGPPCIPLDPSSMSLMAGAPFAYYVPYPNPIAAAAVQTRPIPPPNPTKHYVSRSFTRPICGRCHLNCVNVREGNTNFCEPCFRHALMLRREKESPEANRPKCRICLINCISVKEGGMIYCESCWQDALRKRGVHKDRIMGP